LDALSTVSVFGEAMSGKLGSRIKAIQKPKGRKRKGFASLLDRVQEKRRGSEAVIGYDGESFTRNGKKTARDSLRMG
jgi:hypothetical protein